MNNTSADRNTTKTQERTLVRRVLWRRGRIIVYQDMSGRYLWADLNAGKQRPAVVRAHAS